jgi:glycosyltransferase involved in cell wall biosynthesis
LALGWMIAKWRLRRLIWEWRPDVIFAHHGAVNGYVALRLHRETGIPYVVKDYDFGEIEDCRRFAGRRRVYNAVAHSAATMLSAAKRMKLEMQSQFPGVDVQVSHNGTNPISAPIAATPRPPELLNRFVIASAGIFYERKAFPLLIRAFSKVAAKHANIVLRIVGDGPERVKVEAAMRESPVADRITLLGMQPHESVLRELVWCDIFALIGWDEPFATVYLEALSAGKPILCANDGGINDVLVSGEHGLTVPPRDEDAAVAALERLVVDESLRRHCGARALDLLKTQLNSTATAAKLLEVLEAAARQRAKSS